MGSRRAWGGPLASEGLAGDTDALELGPGLGSTAQSRVGWALLYFRSLESGRGVKECLWPGALEVHEQGTQAAGAAK